MARSDSFKVCRRQEKIFIASTRIRSSHIPSCIKVKTFPIKMRLNCVSESTEETVQNIKAECIGGVFFCFGCW